MTDERATIPILRIPPFPGATAKSLCSAIKTLSAEVGDPEFIAVEIARLRVGGSFWGADDSWASFAGKTHWQGGADDEAALLARCAGLEVQTIGPGRFADCATDKGLKIGDLVACHLIDGWAYHSPYTGDPIAPAEAIALLGQWRQLIEANRRIGPVWGIARWKRPTVTAMLWDGRKGPRYLDGLGVMEPGQRIAAWKSRTPKSNLERAARRDLPVVEIEDGFIRSTGLGADCIPPWSIVVDAEGIYFDPAKPSALETLLREAEIGPDLIARAQALRERIVTHGIGKYGAARVTLPRPAGDRQHILVPGQVEDDRSVMSGGGAVRTNLNLLIHARAASPDAYIIFKPHPDVEAGHRVGALPDEEALRHCDAIVRDQPMSALLDMVDAVHVITSLTGFEALLRGKAVTTYGTPFYAGWGLTEEADAPCPRRGRKRSVDELVAATLILYPRYVDPVTGLPCQPEIVIDRIAAGLDQKTSLLTWLRRMQGAMMRVRWGWQKPRVSRREI